MKAMLRILVVDDSATMRSMYKHMLGRIEGCEISYAADGKQALDLITAEEPHLMFLDVNMPVMDGLTLLDRLRKAGRLERIRVILVTTEGRDEDVRRGLDGGAREYVKKPFRAPDLLPVVERHLRDIETAQRTTANGTGGE
jgi:CheY-like chemotaxis protein